MQPIRLIQILTRLHACYTWNGTITPFIRPKIFGIAIQIGRSGSESGSVVHTVKIIRIAIRISSDADRDPDSFVPCKRGILLSKSL